MLRPTTELSKQTCVRLDAALALGARETWVDRSELGLPEPSPLGRWLCVLEVPVGRISAAGSSGDVDEGGVERAALDALARLDDLCDRRGTSDGPRGGPDRVPVTRIRVAQPDVTLDLTEDAHKACGLA